MTNDWQVVCAGAGLSGLVTAYVYTNAFPNHQPILLIDSDLKKDAQHTITYWADKPTPFDHLALRSWANVVIKSDHYTRKQHLEKHRFFTIKACDLVAFLRSELRRDRTVTMLEDRVELIVEDSVSVSVTTTKGCYSAQYVLDSRPVSWSVDRHLSLQGYGFEIELKKPIQESDFLVFMDTRNTNTNSMEFFFSLPISDNVLIIDYTNASDLFVDADFVDLRLRNYIEKTLKITDYLIMRKEGKLAATPLRVTPRRVTARTIEIGVRGGRLKATTGFAFMRIYHDAIRIVELINQGHALNKLQKQSMVHNVIDRTAVFMMTRYPRFTKSQLLNTLKRKNLDLILSFLDEKRLIY